MNTKHTHKYIHTAPPTNNNNNKRKHIIHPTNDVQVVCVNIQFDYLKLETLCGNSKFVIALNLKIETCWFSIFVGRSIICNNCQSYNSWKLSFKVFDWITQRYTFFYFAFHRQQQIFCVHSQIVKRYTGSQWCTRTY